MNMKAILTILLTFFFSFCFATVSDSLKKDIEDFDYLVSFVEKNYAPFNAIMQKGHKREYKVLKKQLSEQLKRRESNLEKVATDYVMWFYSQFDRHIQLETETFQMAAANIINEAMVKSDSTLLSNPGNFEYAPMLVSCKVDSCTWLIRVPSCKPDLYDGTVNALKQFMESECENLIIDIRGNGGGGDNVWDKYCDLLYDHPYKPEITWFRNTPQNLLFWKQILQLQPSSDFARRFIEKCEVSKKKFEKQGEADSSVNRHSTSRIKRAAVLIDIMTGSSAESIVKFVKNYSDRAKVYGIGNTNGCNLTGNCRTELLPNSKLGVFYATTVDSSFYEKDFSEGLGIAPDVFIPLHISRKLTDNIDEWVLWVAEDLKK